MERPDLFVTALGWEAATVLGGGGAAERLEHSGFRLWRIESGDRETWLLQTGMGADRARAGLEWGASLVRPQAILVTGCAGALDPDLRAGDLVIADRIAASGRSVATPSPRLVERYEEAARAAKVRVRIGPLLTAPAVLSSVEAKRRAAAETACIAVDMESAVVAEWASARGLEFVVARAVIDPAAAALPEEAIDPEGRVRTRRLLRALARRPALAIDLVRLGTAMRRCDRSLRAVHERLLASMRDSPAR